MRRKSTEQVIAEGLPALLRGLERARLDNGPLAAVTGHIKTKDGEVLVTVRADGTAQAGFGGEQVDITAGLSAALGRA